MPHPIVIVFIVFFILIIIGLLLHFVFPSQYGENLKKNDDYNKMKNARRRSRNTSSAYKAARIINRWTKPR